MRVQTVKKRSLNEIALGFWQLSHPGPVLIFLAAVVVFALRAAWPNIVWSTIAAVAPEASTAIIGLAHLPCIGTSI